LADSVGTALFWTLAYAPIFFYTSKSFEAALIGLASAAFSADTECSGVVDHEP
jgi:hypothetical protein